MTVLEVNADNPGEAQNVLRENTAIVSVTQLGIRLRVLVPVDHHDPENLLRQLLASHDVQADIKIIPASLEDVFVASTMASGDTEL